MGMKVPDGPKQPQHISTPPGGAKKLPQQIQKAATHPPKLAKLPSGGTAGQKRSRPSSSTKKKITDSCDDAELAETLGGISENTTDADTGDGGGSQDDSGGTAMGQIASAGKAGRAVHIMGVVDDPTSVPAGSLAFVQNEIDTGAVEQLEATGEPTELTPESDNPGDDDILPGFIDPNMRA